MQNRPRHPPSHNGTHRNACTYFKSHKTRHLCSPQKSLGITVTSSLQTHSRMYTITQPCTHSPIHSPMHSCTYTHITFIHRHTVGDRNSPNITFNHIRTHSTYIHHITSHTHTLLEMFSDTEAYFQLYQPPEVARTHSTLKSHKSIYS